MKSSSLITSAMAGTLLLMAVSASAHPPRYYGPPPGRWYGYGPNYGGTWVAPAIIGGIGLGYLLAQPRREVVVVEPPPYQERCDVTTTRDRYGNRTTTRTCY